ncbi:MAG TPA: sugar phosphate isomerase/epimerase family protein, partial [Urbifossiella sp.]|nr:sugar phosphate isomerase/epimerase family protein [Urbifossiella sp.]
MKPCVSQSCTLPAAVADDLAAFAAAGLPAAEVWLTKLEKHLEVVSADDTAKFLADHGVVLAAAAYQGGLLASHGDARVAHGDHFRRRLDLCQRFGIPTLLVAADSAARSDAHALGGALGRLAEAARWAAGFGMRLGLEFRADAVVNNLDTAITLVEGCGEPNVGVCLDVFHYYKGPSKPEDLERLSAANLAHVQVCDVAGVPREVMTDTDRVLPGEGDFRLDPIIRRLREIGYAGYVSLEL